MVHGVEQRNTRREAAELFGAAAFIFWNDPGPIPDTMRAVFLFCPCNPADAGSTVKAGNRTFFITFPL